MQKNEIPVNNIIGDLMNISDFENRKLTDNIDENIRMIKHILSKDKILRYRRFLIKGKIKCAIFFLDGMVNNTILNQTVIEPLISYQNELEGEITKCILNNILFAAESSEQIYISEMLRGLLYGDTLLIIDGTQTAITVNTKGWRTRGINEPPDERVLIGPREGFDESVMLNMAMIRRKLPTPDLCVETMNIGRSTDTRIFITYLDSLVNRKALNILKEKIKKIDIDSVLDVNYINELITDNKFSLFKTAGSTERPDVVAARLLEGRVAVLVDGTPVVLTLPYLFSENFQSDDDYYQNFMFATAGRIIRYISFFLSISVPAIFLALITHHKQLVPTSFYLTVASSRSDIPFSPLIECLLLIFIFEILREAGLRVPQNMGQALSIVGGLVIGQSAVEAGIVSAPMLIAVAFSGIAGLMVTRLRTSVLFLRIALAFISSFFGLFGYFIAIFLVLYNIFNLSSFGTDSTSSFLNINSQSLKDTLIRVSWRDMITRPQSLSRNKTRQVKK
ncbi:MAG: spore germination protein [Acutalibacteraceae bacterium]|nr:spore germination protein [Acutalibacteraceae bacterium]